MANHKSAEKRAKQSEKKRLRNKIVKTGIKSAVKNVREAVDAKADNVVEVVNVAKSVIDKAAKKGVIHKKNADRNKSRLTKFAATVEA